MPYETIHDLPENVRTNLPEKAQEIYQAAFNNAWEQYEDPAKRRGDASPGRRRPTAWRGLR